MSDIGTPNDAVVFSTEIGLENQLLPCRALVIDVMKKLAVTNKTRACIDDNNVIGASTGIDSAPRFLAAEIYGGGSEYLPFRHLPLWPFSWIRLFAQEE